MNRSGEDNMFSRIHYPFTRSFYKKIIIIFTVFFYNFHAYDVYADDISLDNNQINNNTLDSKVNETNNTLDSSVYVEQPLDDDFDNEYESTCLHESREKYSKKELQGATKFLSQRCKKKDAKSCFSLGFIFQTYLKKYKLAAKYFLISCRLKNQEGCYHFALSQEKKNHKKSIKILKNNCNKNDNQSCRRLAGIYKKNEQNKYAKNFYDRACLNNDLTACHESAMLVSDLNKQRVLMESNCQNGYPFSCRINNILIESMRGENK